MKPAYLADMRSLAYAVLLCHYIERKGLTDEEVNTALSQDGVTKLTEKSLANVYRWRRALARDGLLEYIKQTADARLTKWRLSEYGKEIVQEDLAKLVALETPPVKAKTDGAITNLKSFLRSTRALDPF